MTPEGRVKKLVKESLKKRGIYYHMPVQNGMGKMSLDFICCCGGHFVAIETKADGGEPTARQELTMVEMLCSSAFVFRVNGERDIPILEAYLDLLLLCQPNPHSFSELLAAGIITTTSMSVARSIEWTPAIGSPLSKAARPVRTSKRASGAKGRAPSA